MATTHSEPPEAEFATDEDLDAIDLGEPVLGRIISSEAIFVTDERQHVRAWSSGAQRMLGYTPAEVVGRPCFEVLTGRRPDGHPVCDLCLPGHAQRTPRPWHRLVRSHGRGAGRRRALPDEHRDRPRGQARRVPRGPRDARVVRHAALAICRQCPHGPRRGRRSRAPPGRTTDPARAGGAAAVRARLELDQVAAELSISVFTARNHATSIQHKLGVRNRLQMVLEGMRRGLV